MRCVALAIGLAVSLTLANQSGAEWSSCLLATVSEYQAPTRNWAKAYRDIAVIEHPELTEFADLVLELRLAGFDRFHMRLRFLINSHSYLVDTTKRFPGFLNGITGWVPEFETELVTSDLQYSELQNQIEFLEVQLAEHPDRPAYDSYSSIVRRSEPYVDLFKDADDAKKAAWGRASSAFSQCGRHKSQN